MKILNNKDVTIEKASINVTNMLYKTGYITLRKRGDLLYRIGTGDKSAYKEVKAMLIELADELGSV